MIELSLTAEAQSGGDKTGTVKILPGVDLESILKGSIVGVLRASTTTGRYRKIGHASDLLRQMNPDTVQDRCPACRRLFDTLTAEIGRQ